MMKNELIIENKRGKRKLVSVTKVFLSMDEARKWVEKKYTGYKLVGLQEGLYQDYR